MSQWQRTYRMVGDERVEGTWRNIFIHNGPTYFLTELKIYADGLVDCWGLINVDGFRQKVASGWVATDVPPGAEVSVHGLAHWTVAEQTSHLTGEDLVIEVIDEIDRLAGRPTSSDRCMVALDAFLEAPDETRRDALRAAYLVIPAHLRRFVLGDMDAKDFPLRTLMTRPGVSLDGRTVTTSDHERAMEYFAERRRGAARAEERRRQRRVGRRSAVLLPQVMRLNGWPKDPGMEALRASFLVRSSTRTRRIPACTTRSGPPPLWPPGVGTNCWRPNALRGGDGGARNRDSLRLVRPAARRHGGSAPAPLSERR